MITVIRPTKLCELKCLEKFYSAADEAILSEFLDPMPII